MITLTVNSPLQSLQVISDTKNTNECPIMLTYININPGIQFTPSSIPALFFTNSGTSTILIAPASPNYYDVKYMSVFNADVIQRTITFNLNYNSNNSTLYKCILQVGDSVIYTNGTWKVMDVNGNVKQTNCFANQSANAVFAGPSSGSAAQPAFRALVAADIPAVTPAMFGTDSVDAGVCEGRLTLTSGTPVTTSDVTGATTVYFTPYKGNRLALFDGSATWKLYKFTERSVALGTLTSGLPYDLFIYDNSGTLTLEMVAWTNGTTRATALTTQDGVYVKSGSTNKRYLGTFCTTSITTTEDSIANRYLWNYYNRVNRKILRTESTGSWTYGTGAWRAANNSTANRVNFVIGVQETLVNAYVKCSVTESVATNAQCVGICLDNTNANNADVTLESVMETSGSGWGSTEARYSGYVTPGQHFLQWVEYGNIGGTATFISNSAGLNLSGIGGYLEG